MAEGKTRPGTFKPGNPGRPKGSRNVRRQQVEAIAQQLVNDPKYRKQVKARLLKGDAPQLEQLMWYFAYGKPVERAELSGPGGVPLGTQPPKVEFYLPSNHRGDEPGGIIQSPSGVKAMTADDADTAKPQ